jgi:hypothetical protein
MRREHIRWQYQYKCFYKYLLKCKIKKKSYFLHALDSNILKNR